MYIADGIDSARLVHGRYHDDVRLDQPAMLRVILRLFSTFVQSSIVSTTRSRYWTEYLDGGPFQPMRGKPKTIRLDNHPEQ
jgi:hypothetical protein